EPEPEPEEHSPIRVAVPVARGSEFPQEEAQPPAAAPGAGRGKVALIEYDYSKAEDNEIDLVDGENVTKLDMVDEDWWMGTNSQGETGLFPSNYVKLVEEEEAAPPAPAPAAAPAPAPAASPAPAPVAAAASAGPTATAMYDYEAAEDNGKS